MPELPEVETIKRSLNSLIKGAKLVKFQQLTNYCWQATAYNMQLLKEKDYTIQAFRRHGKYLLAYLWPEALAKKVKLYKDQNSQAHHTNKLVVSKEQIVPEKLQKSLVIEALPRLSTLGDSALSYTPYSALEIAPDLSDENFFNYPFTATDLEQFFVIIFHLRMTGKLVYTETISDLPKHTHFYWQLALPNQAQPAYLYFNDVRRFGGAKLCTLADIFSESSLLNLGFDAYSWQLPPLSQAHLALEYCQNTKTSFAPDPQIKTDLAREHTQIQTNQSLNPQKFIKTLNEFKNTASEGAKLAYLKACYNFASQKAPSYLQFAAFKNFQAGLKRHPKLPIKTALLDQANQTGLGNIYADELLFAAKIAPTTICNQLSDSQIESLFNLTRPLLKEAIGFGGTSFSDYVNGLGKKGNFQYALQVYQRNKLPCYSCQTLIEKCKIGGRSSHYCKLCQKVK